MAQASEAAPFPLPLHADHRLVAQSRERWFGLITDRMVRGGTFHSVDELERGIYAWLAARNDKPKPFVWKATADVMLDKAPAVRKLL